MNRVFGSVLHRLKQFGQSASLMVLLVLGFLQPMYGQKYHVTWADNASTNKYKPVSFIGKHEGNLYVMHFLSFGVKLDPRLQILGPNLNQIQLTPLSILANTNRRSSELLATKIIDNQIHYFYRIYDKDVRTDRLILSKSDMKGNMVVDSMNVLSAPTIGGNHAEFKLIASPDSMQYLITSKISQKDKERIELSFKVLFKNMQDEIWSHNALLPYTNKQLIKIEGQELDNMGNVFVLLSLLKDKDTVGKNESRTYYKVLRYENPTGKLTEYDLDFSGNWISSAKIAASTSNTLNCSGFYTSNCKGLMKICPQGYFSLEIDPAGNIINKRTIEMTDIYEEEDLKLEEDAKDTEKEEIRQIGSTPYHVRKMVHRNNGGHFVIAEQFRSYPSRDSRGNFIQIYICHDLLVIAFDANGKLEWHQVVPKFQMNKITTAGPGVGIGFGNVPIPDNLPWQSFVFSEKNDRIYLFYNAYSEDVNCKSRKEMVRNRNQYIVSAKKTIGVPVVLAAVVDKSGVKKQILMEKKDVKYTLLSDNYLQMDNGDIFFVGVKPMYKSRIGKVAIQ